MDFTVCARMKRSEIWGDIPGFCVASSKEMKLEPILFLSA